MTVGNSEAEPFWTDFLRSLARRGLRGVKLVVSDAHEGLKAAANRVLSATAQRCKVHFQRNAMAHARGTAPHRRGLDPAPRSPRQATPHRAAARGGWPVTS